MIHIKALTHNQREVEGLTGLSREVLRKWELRYEFPAPQRDGRGHRYYSTQEVAKLLLLSQLIRTGMQPGAIVGLPLTELQNMLDAQPIGTSRFDAPNAAGTPAQVQALLATLAPGAELSALRSALQAALLRHGLAAFVAQLMPAFNQAVGQAWLDGQISVAAEHRFTTELRQIVLRALPETHTQAALPVVLLTTPPGELHSLGLLALHAQLRLQGASVVDLDCQTPVPDVLQAVQDFNVGVVAISASCCMPAAAFKDYVQCLAAALPKPCTLWLGGAGCQTLASSKRVRWTVFHDTVHAVEQWRLLAKSMRKPAKKS